MPLKLKKSQAPSEEPTVKNELNGPWGRISAEPHSAITLRVCARPLPNAEELHSYPYRTLMRWHWRIKNAEELLEIEAGPDLVTVKGRGLMRLIDALDHSALEILREMPAERLDDEQIYISSIRITQASDRAA